MVPSENKINCFARDQSLSYYFITLENFEGGNSLDPAVTATVTLWLLPFDVIDFCNVARSEILAENNFIVRCHVTSKQPIRARAVGKKFPAILTIANIDYSPITCQQVIGF